jgi:hypothetical protein
VNLAKTLVGPTVTNLDKSSVSALSLDAQQKFRKRTNPQTSRLSVSIWALGYWPKALR